MKYSKARWLARPRCPKFPTPAPLKPANLQRLKLSSFKASSLQTLEPSGTTSLGTVSRVRFRSSPTTRTGLAQHGWWSWWCRPRLLAFLSLAALHLLGLSLCVCVCVCVSSSGGWLLNAPAASTGPCPCRHESVEVRGALGRRTLNRPKPDWGLFHERPARLILRVLQVLTKTVSWRLGPLRLMAWASSLCFLCRLLREPPRAPRAQCVFHRLAQSLCRACASALVASGKRWPPRLFSLVERPCQQGCSGGPRHHDCPVWKGKLPSSFHSELARSHHLTSTGLPSSFVRELVPLALSLS